jgi:hypothetical protein
MERKEGSEVISDGRLPLNRLDLRLSTWRETSLPRVFGGMIPINPAAGTLRADTCDRSAVHITPCHEHSEMF